jgi:hypothetical protein
MTSKSRVRLCAAALTVAAALVPATASASANPQVVRVDPTTGVAKALAGGAPWTTLGGLAFGPTGTLYVANEGPIGPAPRGAGIYSLASPGFAITPFATAGPTADPAAVVASGSAIYSLDEDRVLSLDAATGAQSVVSSGGLYDQLGVAPAFGTVSGGTLYTTASSTCASAEGGGGYVIAVDLTTGGQTVVKRFGCVALGGVAATPGGKLVVAVEGSAPRIVTLDPSTGVTATLSSGGSLKAPRGIALDQSGDVLVADSTAGVIAVSGQGGDQSPYTAPGAVVGATGIAIGPDNGIYVTEAGVPPTLKASATRRQRYRSSGIALTARCNRTCAVAYTAAIRISGRPGFAKSAAFRNVTGSRQLQVKLPAQVSRQIATALRHGRTVGAKITVRPQDPRTGSAGKATTLRIRIV